jgi:cobalt/nickel transport system permease protein
MHIPDGYLSPVFSLGMGVGTVPAWVIATRRVRAVLDNRTVPLLAIFAAFSFTVMMFNVPVPGGTTAHGVGATLAAIVLGPWAAVITTSTALIIQALFFGDGGILAIFANCFNMGVVLPFVGYGVYRLLAGRAPLLSSRRAWAAGIGGYVGLTAAALLVGVELGVQPSLFNEGGRPLYSPYPLEAAVPAMLVAHMFGASVVEGLITGLVLAYVQRHYPQYLTLVRGGAADPGVPVGAPVERPLWQVGGLAVLGALAVLFVAGLISGGGDVGHLFGADWSQVDWPGVGSMLLVTALIGVVLVPLAWALLPRRIRGIGTAYVVAAVLAPLGLIAPGFAYGEGGAADLERELGYVPAGLQQLSGIFGAPFKDYNLPLPFFSGADAPLWHTALGYEVAGIVGILLLGLAVYWLGLALRGRATAPA